VEISRAEINVVFMAKLLSYLMGNVPPVWG